MNLSRLMQLFLWRGPWRTVCGQSSKLHLGCGYHILDGWLNTDVMPHLWVSRIPMLAAVLNRTGVLSGEKFSLHRAGIFSSVYYLDLLGPFPMSDRMFSYAYTSHVFEHMTRAEAQKCSAEVLRVLRPGGVFRVSVPDLDDCVSRYDPLKADEWCEEVMQSDQSRFRSRHRWMYNFTSLRDLLEEVGFASAVRCKYREGACADIGTFEGRPESLFVEAMKAK